MRLNIDNANGLAKPNNSWLGRQFWNQTFDDEKVLDEEELLEIRGLLDDELDS